MNKEDRKLIGTIDEGISEHLAGLQELIDSLEERIERIQETFPNGNPMSERLEEERDILQNTLDTIEDAKSEMGELL